MAHKSFRHHTLYVGEQIAYNVTFERRSRKQGARSALTFVMAGWLRGSQQERDIFEQFDADRHRRRS